MVRFTAKWPQLAGRGRGRQQRGWFTISYFPVLTSNTTFKTMYVFYSDFGVKNCYLPLLRILKTRQVGQTKHTTSKRVKLTTPPPKKMMESFSHGVNG